MRENWTEVGTGAAVLVGAAAFLFYLLNSTGFAAGGVTYPLTASFRSAEGVSVGTDVRMAGVKVGSVVAMKLDPTTFRAQTTLAVADAVPVPDDSTAVISSEGLLGGNFVEIMPGGSLTNYAPGAEVQDTQGAVSLVSLLMKFVGGAASGSGTATGPQ
ncbi:MAG: outer membrane lipid asymmetry maintenance protein MlaD [Limimaricola sp.]|uniref:outer membrane lipid asymmetry maintenance protein MlaD n=1 Tax=Limimaricola sp. TaxID=2211665 RepID=UPI001DBC3E9D|nr:outer membrane lipid asymmetry maintenance protein MlaD [Limimaricola sp.]MBI1416486.1 outer membrane lipid asymmetry maintenance protein MlaD [Limimaricola sp.]